MQETKQDLLFELIFNVDSCGWSVLSLLHSTSSHILLNAYV